MDEMFTVFWTNGTVNYIEGKDIADAFNKNGFGAGTLAAVDFYSKGVDLGYYWNKETHNWVKKKEINIHHDQAKDMKQADFLNLLNDHKTIQIEYSGGHLLSLDISAGCYWNSEQQKNTYVRHIAICFCEYNKGSYFDDDDENSHYYMVCNGQYMDDSEKEEAVDVLIRRIPAPFRAVNSNKCMSITDLMIKQSQGA